MKITVESTEKIVELHGVSCRIWEGVSEKGVPLYAYIPRVSFTGAAAAAAEFERDLEEQAAPREVTARVEICGPVDTDDLQALQDQLDIVIGNWDRKRKLAAANGAANTPTAPG